MTNHNLKPFKVFNEQTAPDASKAHLKAANDAFGLIPNVEGVMSQAPTLLASYMMGWDQFNQNSLTEQERQVVYQTANFENNCEYCMPWHTILAEQAGLSEEDVEALRNASPLSDTKLEALRIFSRDLVRTQGSVEPNSLQTFFTAGYGEKQALEVVLGLAVKTMSNYTNAIAQTKLDDDAQSKKWKKPSLRG